MPRPNLETLTELHRCHVMTVPFECLDIHYGSEIRLDVNHIYNKVVLRRRGGYCYELNTLFNKLLKALGYQSRIISSRIYNSEGDLGPEYDHMSILVQLDVSYLVDVGYGDLFIYPLEIDNQDYQKDGSKYFKVQQLDDKSYQLLVSQDKIKVQPKYVFDTRERSLAEFQSQNVEKQTSPLSKFVKNKICTLPKVTGRITIYNDRLKVIKDGLTTERQIRSEEELFGILAREFGIEEKYVLRQ